LPARRDEPLSRYSTADLARLVGEQPAAPPMSPGTTWRLLGGDALQPWRSRSWLFPRGPHFAAQAGRVLGLDAGYGAGRRLHPDDGLLSADEQTSSQARLRRHRTTPPGPHQPARVEHESARGGARAYWAAWDLRRGGVSGRGEATTGKAPFGRLGDPVVPQAPARAAPRVCWSVDQGSSHRGDKAARELAARYPPLRLGHLPTHAAWLNQPARYFALVQRTVLTPNAVPALAAVARRRSAFAARYNDTAVPVHWRFTRADLERRLAQLPADRPEPAMRELPLPAAA
jgi:hypothetical protein